MSFLALRVLAPPDYGAVAARFSRTIVHKLMPSEAAFIATPPMEPSTTAFNSHKPVDSMTWARKRTPAR